MTLRMQYLLLFMSFLITCVPSSTYAAFVNATIAKTYLISGETALSGDLVSFEPATQTFHLAHEANDKDLFGVVVQNPVIVLRTTAEGAPVVSTGEVYMNVTTLGGPISAGDYLTSSVVPGKGEKVASSTVFTVGTALESFPPTTGASVLTGTSTVYTGSIRVLLTIGPYGPAAGTLLATEPTPENDNTARVSTPLGTLIRYLLATGVVLGTIYLAFRNFGSNLKDSVVSVGRNPLAKASIQSMVVLNTSLIVLVSAVGLFVGLMILFLPI